MIKQICFLVWFCSCFLPAKSFSYTAGRDSYVSKKDTAHQIYIKINTSKNVVYAGEPLVVEYLLYFNASVTDPQNSAKLLFTDCYAEEFKPDNKISVQHINSREYRVRVIKKYLLIPNSSGELAMPLLSLNVKLTAPPSADDFFEQEKVITRKIASSPFKIQVLPLPPGLSTGNFCGAIGNFTTAGTFKPSAQNPKMLTVSLTLKGYGNLKTTHLPQPVVPLGTEIYNLTATSSDKLTDDGLLSEYTLSYQLVAGYKNEYRVSAPGCLVFDIKTGSYKLLLITDYKWKVNSGLAMPASLLAQQPALNRKPVLYIKNDLGSNRWEVNLGKITETLLMLALCLFLSGYLYQKNGSKIFHMNDFDQKRAKRKALQAIRRITAKGDVDMDDTVVKRLEAILHLYLTKKGCVLLNDNTLAETSSTLKNKHLPQTLQDEVTLFLHHCNALRFAYVKPLHTTAALSEKLTGIIKNLDFYLHAKANI
jgi:hypothetical protein